MGIHLTEFHDAVRQTLTDRFDWLGSVDYYPEVSTELTAPCAFFAVDDWSAADDQPMNDQLAVELSCELLVVFGMAEPAYQLEIRNAAMAVCLAVNQARWGLEVEPARLVGAQPDGFSPELDAYAVWRIQWRQLVRVGDDFFEGDGLVPTQVKVGYAPLIGVENERYYTEVTDGSPLSDQ